jgi:hypothetical protein
MKKNIHILATDQPSTLYKRNDLNTLHIADFDICDPNDKLRTNQFIYITSSEEINEGDWCIDIDDFITKPILNIVYKKNICPTHVKQIKIILTTDPKLITDGIQSIDDEFLEWFVKNPTCEYVKVHFWSVNIKDKITYKPPLQEYTLSPIPHTPQEEPKQETRVFGTKDDKSFWSDKPIQEEHLDIQETLTENAENFAKTRVYALKDKKEWNPDCIYHEAFNGYIVGSAEIAERMYSEAEVEQLLHLAVFQSQCTSNRITRLNSNNCADFVNKWFRINKKK